MQDESIKQSLLLWAVYMKQINDSAKSQEVLGKNIETIEKNLKKAGVTKVKLYSTILNYYTIMYTQERTNKIIQFNIDKLKQTDPNDISIFIENES